MMIAEANQETPLERKRRQRRESWFRNHERSLERSRAYYAAHKKHLNALSRAYHAAHRDQLNESRKRYLREWYQKNKERVKQNSKLYHRQHPEVARRYRLKIQRLYPEKYKAREISHSAKRRALKLGCPVDGKAADNLIKRWKSEVRFICYYCQNKFSSEHLHIDHIIPLSKGGRHAISNLCRSCGSCNRRKHIKDVSELELDQPLLSL